jgi:hypothetical protein
MLDKIRSFNSLVDLIVENSDDNFLTLYRGDSSDIGTHSLDKGDVNALFGQGIYLTSNKRIAGDYKLKGSQDVIFRGNGFKTKEKVLDAYFYQKAQFIDVNGKESYFPISFSNTFPSAENAKRLEFAKQKWDEIKDQYDVRINVDGSSAIVKKQSGNISVYRIPLDIINRTYDVEDEIEDTAIDSLCSAIRVTDGNCRILKDIVGKDEDGFLPTFRNVWNELRRMDYLSDKESQIAFRKAMRSNGGYKGLEYAGGVTMGGGIHHRAFVLWDEQGLIKYRIK